MLWIFPAQRCWGQNSVHNITGISDKYCAEDFGFYKTAFFFFSWSQPTRNEHNWRRSGWGQIRFDEQCVVHCGPCSRKDAKGKSHHTQHSHYRLDYFQGFHDACMSNTSQLSPCCVMDKRCGFLTVLWSARITVVCVHMSCNGLKCCFHLVQHLRNGKKIGFCVGFEFPDVIYATVRARMNHCDSEAVSLSGRHESHGPVVQRFCVAICVSI